MNIEKQLRDAGILATRVPGVQLQKDDPILNKCWEPPPREKCAGQVGCQRSHIEALMLASRRMWPQVAVFEDDFQWRSGIDTEQIESHVEAVQQWAPDLDKSSPFLSIFRNTTIFQKGFASWCEQNFELGATTRHRQRTGTCALSHVPILLETFKNCDIFSSAGVAIDPVGTASFDKLVWPGTPTGSPRYIL